MEGAALGGGWSGLSCLTLRGNGAFCVSGDGVFKSCYKQNFPQLVWFLNVSTGEDSFLDRSLHRLYWLQSGCVITEAVVITSCLKNCWSGMEANEGNDG